MDNELDHRLRRLEAGQERVLSGQAQVLARLAELTALVRQPDEEGEKLHDVLAQMVAILDANTAALRELKRALGPQTGI
jgi:predicted transcriptional regulator